MKNRGYEYGSGIFFTHPWAVHHGWDHPSSEALKNVHLSIKTHATASEPVVETTHPHGKSCKCDAGFCSKACARGGGAWYLRHPHNQPLVCSYTVHTFHVTHTYFLRCRSILFYFQNAQPDPVFCTPSCAYVLPAIVAASRITVSCCPPVISRPLKVSATYCILLHHVHRTSLTPRVPFAAHLPCQTRVTDSCCCLLPHSFE